MTIRSTLQVEHGSALRIRQGPHRVLETHGDGGLCAYLEAEPIGRIVTFGQVQTVELDRSSDEIDMDAAEQELIG